MKTFIQLAVTAVSALAVTYEPAAAGRGSTPVRPTQPQRR
jgi:hypothetical protein